MDVILLEEVRADKEKVSDVAGEDKSRMTSAREAALQDQSRLVNFDRRVVKVSDEPGTDKFEVSTVERSRNAIWQAAYHGSRDVVDLLRSFGAQPAPGAGDTLLSAVSEGFSDDTAAEERQEKEGFADSDKNRLNELLIAALKNEWGSVNEMLSDKTKTVYLYYGLEYKFEGLVAGTITLEAVATNALKCLRSGGEKCTLVRRRESSTASLGRSQARQTGGRSRRGSQPSAKNQMPEKERQETIEILTNIRGTFMLNRAKWAQWGEVYRILTEEKQLLHAEFPKAGEDVIREKLSTFLNFDMAFHKNGAAGSTRKKAMTAGGTDGAGKGLIPVGSSPASVDMDWRTRPNTECALDSKCAYQMQGPVGKAIKKGEYWVTKIHDDENGATVNFHDHDEKVSCEFRMWPIGETTISLPDSQLQNPQQVAWPKDAVVDALVSDIASEIQRPAGQFVLDNAAHLKEDGTRYGPPFGVAAVQHMVDAMNADLLAKHKAHLCSRPLSFKLVNGYLELPKVETKQDKEVVLEAYKKHFGKMRSLRMDNVPASGVNWDDYSDEGFKNTHRASVVYASAVPLNYGSFNAHMEQSVARREAWNAIALMNNIGQYYAALQQTAALHLAGKLTSGNYHGVKRRRIFLMLLGGGVFQNTRERHIGPAIIAAVNMLTPEERRVLHITVLAWSDKRGKPEQDWARNFVQKK
eukprot:g11399.t1